MTRIYLGLVANGVLFLSVGYALLYALGLARLRRSDLRLLGLAYLSGWALLGVVLSLSLIVGIHMELWTIVLAAALLAVAGALFGRRAREAMPAAVPRSRHPLAAAATGIGAAILLIEAVAALVVSVQNLWTPDIDLMTAWMPRAEAIYYEHSLVPSIWGAFVTPWYPPLVPTMYAGAFQFVGGFHPSALALQQTLLGLAFLGAVLGLLDRFAPRWLTFPSLALLLSTPWFWWRLHSLLPDQTLAYLLVGAALACVIWLHERRGAWLGLAVVFLAAATLTKVEGGLFGALLAGSVLAAGFALHRRPALPAFVLLLGPAATVPWRLWLTQHRVPTTTPDYNAPNALSVGFLSDRLDRLTFALDFMVRAPFHAQPITAVLVCVSIVVLLVAAPWLPGISVAIGAWLVLSFVSLAFIYWISRVEIHFYVGTSASRVGTTLIIAAATVAPLLLGLALRRAAPADG